jgi:pyridoxine 4-dehydrogenase
MASLSGQVAFGSAGLAFGRFDEAESYQVIRSAYAAGIRIFDTARVYAPPGDEAHGERMLREALDGYPEVIVSTKGGHWREGEAIYPVDNRPERLRKDVDTSLRALRLDRLPLFFVHRVDMDDVPIEEIVGTLADLRCDGKIERIGISNVSTEQIERAAAVAPIDAVQNRVSVRADPAWDPSVALCDELGITLFGFGVFNSHPNDPDKRPIQDVLPNLAVQAELRGVPLQRLAVRALLSTFPSLSLIVGATRKATAEEAGAMLKEPWTEDTAAAYARDRAGMIEGDYRQRPLTITPESPRR